MYGPKSDRPLNNRHLNYRPLNNKQDISKEIAENDEEDRLQQEDGEFLQPDRDFYRKMITTFQTVHGYFENRIRERSLRDHCMLQPHHSSYSRVMTPHNSAVRGRAADGVCAHFLRRGFTKPNKTHFKCATWSHNGRWLYLGTEYGQIATWEGGSLKVKKMTTLLPHRDGREMKAVTAIAKNNHGGLLCTGDSNGLYQFCDETLRTSFIKKEAHEGQINGLSFAPNDSKIVSVGDDSMCHVWTIGRDIPDCTLTGHQSDIKAVDWHPFRSLVATGSRDSAVRLWDPKAGSCVSLLNTHKKQINCLQWNRTGNWLATGAKDGLMKVYDIRMMKELEIYKGHNSDVTGLGWHPLHEKLLLSGGYNGSLCYWVVGQNQAPHTVIAQAHRQYIDIVKWHPEGHMVATASHDCVIKFWCREYPGSTLLQDTKEFVGAEFAYGPIPNSAPSIIPTATYTQDLRQTSTAGMVDVRDLRDVRDGARGFAEKNNQNRGAPSRLPTTLGGMQITTPAVPGVRNIPAPPAPPRPSGVPPPPRPPSHYGAPPGSFQIYAEAPLPPMSPQARQGQIHRAPAKPIPGQPQTFSNDPRKRKRL